MTEENRRSRYGVSDGYRDPPRDLHPLIFELRKRRFDLGISQLGLSDKMGYEVSSLRKWETGVQVPSYPSLLNWCDALGVRLALVPDET